MWPFAEAPAARRDRVFASVRELPLEVAHVHLLSEVFGGMDARAGVPGVLDASATWRPDVIVSEPIEFAGRLAAAHLALPVVSISVTQCAVGSGFAGRRSRRSSTGMRTEHEPAPHRT